MSEPMASPPRKKHASSLSHPVCVGPQAQTSRSEISAGGNNRQERAVHLLPVLASLDQLQCPNSDTYQ